jgi:hypothetical protein
MARRKVSPGELFHRRLLGEILRSQAIAGESDEETSVALGIKAQTFKKTRMKDPRTFKADEVFRAAAHFHWDAETLGNIFTT